MSPVTPGTRVDPRHSGHAQLVVVRPPFGPPLRPGERPPATAHDPAAARAAVLFLSSVAAIRGEHAPAPLQHPGSPADRAELDVVHAAVWGPALRISDPALVEDGVLTGALEDEFHAWRKRCPDARIVAACERDFGAAYLKILVAVPGAPELRVEGFDELEIDGDWRATLRAAGFDPELLGGDDEFGDDAFLDHDGLLHALTGGALSVYADEERRESAFVVERTEEGEQEIREVWFS